MAGKKQKRVLDLTYYDWSILRWTTSDTRNLLDATGIGIYRELLDRCYAQGSIPADPDLQARIAKCTAEQLAAVWPFIKSNFRALKNRPGRLENAPASVYRANNFSFRGSQTRSGEKGGRAKAIRTKDMSSDPTRVEEKDASDPTSHLLTNLPTILTLPTTKPKQQYGDWPLTAAAIEEHFDAIDFPFLLKLAHAAAAAVASVDSPRIILSDEILAKAVRYCYRSDTQFSAGMYLTTVPPCIKTWAKSGVRSRDSPEAPQETETQRRERDAQVRDLLRIKGIFPVGEEKRGTT